MTINHKTKQTHNETVQTKLMNKIIILANFYNVKVDNILHPNSHANFKLFNGQQIRWSLHSKTWSVIL